MILIKIAIACIIAAWGYLIFDCLMGGKKQKPVKQQSVSYLDYEQQDKKQQALKSNNRVKIRGTNVTGAGIYTQDWDSDETAEDRVARLKRLAMQSTKVNRRTK